VANLSKTLRINFYQNRSSIVEVVIKNFGVFMPHSVRNLAHATVWLYNVYMDAITTLPFGLDGCCSSSSRCHLSVTTRDSDTSCCMITPSSAVCPVCSLHHHHHHHHHHQCSAADHRSATEHRCLQLLAHKGLNNLFLSTLLRRIAAATQGCIIRAAVWHSFTFPNFCLLQ